MRKHIGKLIVLIAISLCLEARSDQPKMSDLLKQIAAESEETNPILGKGKLRSLRAELAALPADATPDQLVPLLLEIGEQELRQGNIEGSIEALTRADTIIQKPESASYFAKAAGITSAYRLGIAYMRLGETQNCFARHTGQSCIMPISGSGIHTVKDGSTTALQHLQRVLKLAPQDSTMYLRAQWLYNIAAMTLGQYPNDVPKEYVISQSVFASEEDFPHFQNVAAEVGVNSSHLAGGVIADDFDNDGFLDILVSDWNPSAPLEYLHNNKNGTFSNRSAEAHLSDVLGGFNLIQADYNNDGFVDVLVLRGAWLGEKGKYPKSLLKNNGDGTFTDVTFESGLGEAMFPSQTAAWADYDHDGDLDLYIGNETAYGVTSPCEMFRNEGGKFVDVAEKAGVTNLRFAKSVVWGDYDNDGDPDLYVSNLGQPNRLYRNNGDGTFSDIAQEAGVVDPQWSFGAWFWDYDNDGNLDLYVSWYDWGRAGLGAVASSYLGKPGNYEPPRLYRGDGKGHFQNVAESCHLVKGILPMGVNFGDLDNDGYLDFYLGTGYPDYESLIPNVMYHNQQGRRFADVTTAGGFGHLQKGHGIAFADFDNDGRQDVFEQMGGFFRGDASFNTLYRNPGFSNHWVDVLAQGVQSNRSAIGARIHIVITENGKERSIYKHVNSGATFGANPLRQTIGLGKAEKIIRLEILWPTTGKTQVFENVPMDRLLRIKENADTLNP